ncbi:hypothetical protein, partial [Halomonas sp. ND22Bw]|uniref:hypothetical protein n=1 Tax=Halomonas sp. ND22Bw TaxID=2054178 RepID=UPI001C6394FF
SAFKPHRSISSLSSASSIKSSSREARFAKKTFFKPNKDDGLVKRLCRDKQFKEAISILCEQNRLKEAVQILPHIDRPSATIYSTLLGVCLR